MVVAVDDSAASASAGASRWARAHCPQLLHLHQLHVPTFWQKVASHASIPASSSAPCVELRHRRSGAAGGAGGAGGGGDDGGSLGSGGECSGGGANRIALGVGGESKVDERKGGESKGGESKGAGGETSGGAGEEGGCCGNGGCGSWSLSSSIPEASAKRLSSVSSLLSLPRVPMPRTISKRINVVTAPMTRFRICD